MGLVALLVLTPSLLLAQSDTTYDPERQLTSSQTREDLRVLREALEAGHGGLYAHTPEAEMSAAFDAASATLDAPTSERELLLELMKLVKLIHDGHTSISESSAHREWLDSQPIYAPFKLEFRSGRAYTRYNYSADGNLETGEEVVAINGRPMGTITRDMKALLSSDGRSDAGVYLRLSGTLQFARLHSYLYGPATTWSYRLRSRTTGSLRNLSLPGLEADTVQQRFRERYSEDRPTVELTWHGKIPVLRMSGMVRSVGDESVESFLKRAFGEIENREAEHLVIDFRDNGGGADATGKHLMSHLLDEPFTYYDALTARTNVAPYARYTGEDPEEIAKHLASFTPRPGGGFDVPGHSNLGIQQPRSPHFAGRVTVLIGPQTFSAATETLAVMWAHDRATLVGTETGGAAVGNTSGASVRVTLPHSGIRLNMPLHRYHQAVGEYPHPERGFLPDYVLEPTLDELLRGDDPVLDFVLGMQ